MSCFFLTQSVQWLRLVCDVIDWDVFFWTTVYFDFDYCLHSPRSSAPTVYNDFPFEVKDKRIILYSSVLRTLAL